MPTGFEKLCENEMWEVPNSILNQLAHLRYTFELQCFNISLQVINIINFTLYETVPKRQLSFRKEKRQSGFL